MRRIVLGFWRGCLSIVLATSMLFTAGCASTQSSLQVLMQTTEGTITIELEPDRAPITVANFLRYVDGGHYDGATFYRTVRYTNDRGNPKIEVIQGGIGDREVFEPIAHEDTDQTGLRHLDGTLSMARGEVGTASSEFFIVIGDQPGLDRGESRNPDKQGFAAFGRVIEGMDVVRRIHQAPSDAPSSSNYTAGQIMEAPVAILSVRRRSP